MLLALEVLERCVGARLLQEHRSRQQAALQRAHTPGRADGGESAAAAQREAAAATAAAREREAAAEQALLSASEAQQVAREQARPLICIPSISLSTPLSRSISHTRSAASRWSGPRRSCRRSAVKIRPC